MPGASGHRAVVSTAPTRLDFGGGWTDVPPYPEERGGFVCNVAIDRFATVRVSELVEPVDEALKPPLVRTALRRAGLDHLAVEVHSDFPVGAGLGGSSALGVALSAALARWQGRTLTRTELAEWSRLVEVQDLGIAGGRQDHYAAAFGGALGLRFTGSTTKVESIAMSDRAVDALQAACLLVYTGESRISGDTIRAVLDAYRARTPRVVGALERMRTLAEQMRNALALGDIAQLAALVDEHWTHQRALHPSITTERIDALDRSARQAGATAVKALGASGGGCVVVFRPPGDDGRVAAAVSSYGTLLPWRLAFQGVGVLDSH
jgi:D-glycero-alpha-D-manno-heptose-7-phosphate kinase